MKMFSDSLTKRAGAAALLFILPSVVYAGVDQRMDSTQNLSNSVHKVTHSLAGNIRYSTAPSYKWGSQPNALSAETNTDWATAEAGQPSYKWPVNQAEVAEKNASNTFAGDASYNWGAQNFSSQAGYKWGFRGYADQAGYKWGFRSYADQAGYKWGFRSYADQAGYKWGFRGYADQAGYKWGFRSYADQAGYKWGFRSYADQAGYKWGFR
jgi:hypothetical protein